MEGMMGMMGARQTAIETAIKTAIQTVTPTAIQTASQNAAQTATQTWNGTRTVNPAARTIDRGVRALAATDGSAVQAVLRLGLALVIFPHGAQKVFGWFGGYGFEGTMGYLTGTIGAPWILALLAIAAEFVGPIALALGLFGRVAAFGIANVMVVAVATTHLTHGFFMDWNGAMAGEGFEYHLLVLAIAVALMIDGSGALSLDRVLVKRWRGPQRRPA